ncbi:MULTISPECIES: hypothetical protein [unclassified Minwuia]|jgi:predicted Na+-dependent transporter|uniref:hypothetical protein n=1 Tax=unclassified Minwuia TaxID=2618799 RepID=UPI0024799A00|nr:MULTISPECIES: hypothetical protein [unclassified Minwuia]
MHSILLSPLAFIGRHATRFLALAVVIGFAIPPLSTLVRPWLAAFIVLPLVIALMRIDWADLWAYARRWKLIGLLCLWMIVVSPVLTWLILRHLGLTDGVLAGMVLMAAAPPIVSAAAIAIFLRLDGAIVIVTTVAAMWLTPFILPPMALNLLDLALEISLGTFMMRLGLLVAVAFGLAWTMRRLLGQERLIGMRPQLDGAAVLAMTCFVVGVFDGVTEMALQMPGHVLATTALAFAFNIVLQVAGAALFWHLGPRIALAVGLMSGNCNMGLVLVTLADRAEPDTIMYFAVGQAPMYTLPVLLTPVYRWLVARADRRTEGNST